MRNSGSAPRGDCARPAELSKDFVSSSTMTGQPEVIPLRSESAPVHLILRQNIPGALGDT